jgi:DNA-3-methyladenine glycosylase II
MVKVPLTFNHHPHVAEVKAIGTTEKPIFEITGTDEKGIETVKDIFQWDVELEKIHSHFQNTTLKSLFNEHYGTALVLEFDPYSSLLKSIIHQQLNLKFAHTLTERFVQTYGSQIDGVWFYPSPKKVAVLTVEDLRELQFSGRKAEYVIGVAEKVSRGELNFKEMKHLSNQEIHDILIKLRGVGPWTVQNFLMFGLGQPNLFPMADIGLQNALKKLFSLAEKPGKADMEQYIKDWEPYLSYASLYLWRSIEKGA